MNAVELIRNGKISEASDALRSQIRASPADAKLRVFLFQLLLVDGQWDKALAQLNIAADLDPIHLLMAETCRPLLQCEALRQQVFAGTRSPLVMGEPADWIGWLFQAAALTADGKHQIAAEVRTKAFDAAPAISGTINDQPFEWVADADSRLGPVLEAVVDGKYYWIPMANIAQITLEKPIDLRDIVWLGGQFTWTNGGTAIGFIPVRYPGSEAAADPAVRLARRTDWQDHEGAAVGLGQRTLVTDSAEYPLLEIRSLVMNQPAPVTAT